MLKYVKNVSIVIIGCILMSLGIVLFLLPNQLSSGGFSGITTVLYYLFQFKVGTTTLIMNIPLFVYIFIRFGKQFFFQAITRYCCAFIMFRFV